MIISGAHPVSYPLGTVPENAPYGKDDRGLKLIIHSHLLLGHTMCSLYHHFSMTGAFSSTGTKLPVLYL